MLGGDSGSRVLESSDDAAAAMAAAVKAHQSAEAAGVGSNSGEEDKGDRSSGGNRWPREETMALLRIRSDMDVTFRDASVKGPLWEEVSRKLAELGYHRSAKKCKEKFENVYKYHKRTKEGRTGKPDGKTYRFFDQLEAFDNHPNFQQSSSSPAKSYHQTAPVPSVPAPATVAMRPFINPPTLPPITVTSATHTNIAAPATNLKIPSFPPTNPTILPSIPSSNFPNISADLISNSTSSSSSSTSSDEEVLEVRRRKRKRKWKDFFGRLMREVIQKQEELNRRFLEAIEKREHERMVREEAWRVQEMARITREREILAQERSMAATKDAAVMSFLQKISEQQNPGQAAQFDLPQPQPLIQQAAPSPALPVQQPPAPISTPPAATVLPQTVTSLGIQKVNNNGGSFTPRSSSRWPKVEVQALIKLRTNLDEKYQDSGPKGPLWEEISAAMKKLGYNRSSKRCKEKWENINKYFKKVKESNKKRPEDSKTCPYFHQLDALYKQKNKLENPVPSNQVKPEHNMVPLMVQPEQQWPPRQDQQPSDKAMEDVESEPMDENQEEDDDDKDGDDEEEEEEEDEDGSANFEIVASKPASIGAAE